MDFILGIAGGAIGYIAYAVIYIITTIAGVVISIIVYLIGVILQLSNNIVNTLAVQSGFQVTLAIANLGFILGIIIIAIATILRRETYGIKKTLWKLVVAAILVNFSLVIGGAIINFANTFTTAFMAKLPGSGGGNGPLAFADQLAGAFAPQRALLQLNASTSVISGTISGKSIENADAGNDLASIVTPLIGVSQAAGLLIVIVITLAVFLFMLLIRYVTLAILLVLMPFAWLMWLFPKTAHLWSKWWDTFIRWTFFSPIVIFFLYLAIATAQSMNNVSSGCTPAPNHFCGDLAFLNGTQYQAEGSAVLGGISGRFGSFIGRFAGTALQGVIVIGLAIGGMIVADKMSIMGSKAALGAMTTVGNAAKGYMGKQAKKGVSAMVPSGVKEKLQRGDYGIVPRRAQSWMGRGLQTVESAGTADLVEKEAGWAKEQAKDPKSAARLLEGSLNKEQRLALLKQMMNQNDIDSVKKVGGKGLGEFLNDKKYFTSANQEKLFLDLNKRIESTPGSRSAAKKLAEEQEKIDPAIATIENNVKSLDVKLAAIERAGENARKALARNPDAFITDNEGVVAQKGQRMKVGDYIDLADKRYAEVDNTKKRGLWLKEDIQAKAEDRATVIDEEGKLGTPGATVNAKKLLDRSMDDHVMGQKKEDAQRALVNDIFGKGQRFGLDERTADILGESFARSIANRAPGFIGSFLGKLKSEPLDKLTKTYEGVLGQMEKQALGDKARTKQIKDLKDAFSKATAFNRYYVAGWDAGAGTPAPEAPEAGGGAKSGGGQQTKT